MIDAIFSQQPASIIYIFNANHPPDFRIMPDRYDASSTPEGQYQPGSNGKVLLNKPGITDPDEMDNLEFDLFVELQSQLLNEIQLDSKIQVKDLCEWHKRWLGNVYEWAGKYRSVNLSKDSFHFAAAHLIPKLMNYYNDQYLKIYTPCEGMNNQALIEALSVCHVEFILIHPFRDGNGRVARLLATIMALQANKPPLDFEILQQERNQYISAIHAGHSGDNGPMMQLFHEVLKYSEQQAYRNADYDNG